MLVSGPELRDARQAAGLSLQGLAVRLGVHWVTVWRWETGRLPVPQWAPLALSGLVDSRRSP